MSQIILYTSNVIGKAMTGPAIRAWEMAKALSLHHTVSLVAPNQPAIAGEGFHVVPSNHPTFKRTLQTAHILITQNLSLSMAMQAKRFGVKIIIDAYDPLPLELLELFKHHPYGDRQERLFSSLNQLIFNFKMADGILCASEKQRDLWLGFLLGHKLISSARYDQDNSLRQLITVVPFGLPKAPPVKTGPGLREKYAFSPQDSILLWGGGIWNWFDPLTLIKAVKRLSAQRSAIKLVFMGIKNPDPTVPEMTMCLKAIELAKELKLLDQTVFFNQGWVPYEERQNILLDATLGLSTHFDHLETRYSFRTRMLDYIWSGLPILATTGDSFAELIERHQLGRVVPYQDEQTLADAIISLVDHKEQLELIKGNLKKVSSHFHWETIVQPLEGMIARLIKQQSGPLDYQHVKTLISYLSAQVAEKGFKQSAQLLLKKLFR